MTGPTSDIDGVMDAEDVRLLAEIGFMVLSRGLDGPAEILFRGVAAARPSGEAGPIGAALVSLYRGRTDAAVDILRALPRSDAADLFLGMALMRAGESEEARLVLVDLVASSPGSPEGESARQILAGG